MKRKLFSLIFVGAFSVVFTGGAYAAETIKAYMGTSPDNNVKIVNFIKEDIIHLWVQRDMPFE